MSCEANQLSSLDLRANTSLTDLSCGSNHLSSLDVSENTELKSLSCDEGTMVIGGEGIEIEYLPKDD